MPVEVVLPMLGITVERGRILKWHKAEGQKVKKGEILFEVETEKVVTEVESPATGILARVLVPEGVEVPLLTVVGVILEETEEVLPDLGKESLGPERLVQEPVEKKAGAPSPRSAVSWELAVLGGGPAGYAAAIRAAQRGAQVVLVEKESLGGTCLHRGCIPTKSFLWDVELLRRVRDSQLLVGGHGVGLDLSRMVARKDQVVARLHKGLESLVQSLGVTVVSGAGELLDTRTLRVKANGQEEIYGAGHIIIATGSRPRGLAKVEVDGERILFSDHLAAMKVVPERLVVIGGGAIGLEWAAIMKGLGAQVTILEVLPRLLAQVDEEMGRILERALEEQGIRVLTQVQLKEVKAHGQEVEIGFVLNGESMNIGADQVLVAVGRQPNTEGIGVERLGLDMDGPFIRVDSTMRSSVPWLYAAGDVIGGTMLAHAAFAEASVAVENILGGSRQLDYSRVPRCVYTSPEVAWVGLTEAQAREQGYGVKVQRFPFGHNGKALAMGEPEGLVKIIAEEELGQILGVCILGANATELLGECLVAMRLEATVEELGDLIKPHPTLSEAITEAAMAWTGRPLHMAGVHKP
ncbi:MAG: dihydrolipoyl dehydrogenase [bacterium]